jgi:hypothetical protein
MDKVVFIISHKYFRGYPSYLEYYIDNIQTNYPTSLIIVVDNNSTYKDDIFNPIKKIKNLVLLDNNTECKFEIGAYKVGMSYVINNNLIEKYDYYIFTQDTFILKNKFNFDRLKSDNVKACSIVSWDNDWSYNEISIPILISLGLNNNLERARLCWCSSFILEKENITKMLDFIKNITIIDRVGSMASERYLGRLLWELNNGSNYDIDGDIDNLSYYCHSVEHTSDINHFFCKIAQQKNENTKDI